MQYSFRSVNSNTLSSLIVVILRSHTFIKICCSRMYLEEEKSNHGKSQNWTFPLYRFSCHHRQCTSLHTLLIMTAKSMLSKRLVLRFTVALFFLFNLFCSILIVFIVYLLDNSTSVVVW